MYDVIIVGAGPAGMTAALYAQRNGKQALVIEKGSIGGQITFSPKVENIPGFASLSGNEFADKFMEQILAQGADLELERVTGIEPFEADGKPAWKIHTEYGGDFEGRSVILALGVKHRMLGLPGEEDLVGEGISFCAVCDGAFYQNKTVAVIGGGNSALQEAILLSEQCAKVYVVQNLETLTGEQKLRDQLSARPNVEIILGTVVEELLGETSFAGIRVRRVADNTLTDLAVDGMFVAIGLIPQNEPFSNVLPLNSYGYADADESCLTPNKGIFVAGDCRSKKIRQVTTAAADGAIAALAACDYIG